HEVLPPPSGQPAFGTRALQILAEHHEEACDVRIPTLPQPQAYRHGLGLVTPKIGTLPLLELLAELDHRLRGLVDAKILVSLLLIQPRLAFPVERAHALALTPRLLHAVARKLVGEHRGKLLRRPFDAVPSDANQEVAALAEVFRKEPGHGVAEHLTLFRIVRI